MLLDKPNGDSQVSLYPGKGLMVSRVVWDHEVAGSTPATRTSSLQTFRVRDIPNPWH